MNLRLLITIIASQIIEWYDFTLYGFFAGIFATTYFPSSNHVISLLTALAVFAISFLARPIGSVIFGALGDKYGRKGVYFNSFLLMGLATFSIGFIPSYNAIGIWAPIMLIVLRLVQGLSCGGIFTSAIVMLGEHAPRRYCNFFSSLPWLGSLTGTLFGSGVATVITHHFNHGDLYDYGWRFAYIIGGIISFVGLAFQSSITETKEFIKNSLNENAAKNPLMEAFKSHKSLMLKIMGANIYLAVISYMSVIYMPIYLSSILKYPLHTVLLINTISIFILITLIPIFGYLNDKFGTKKIFIFSSVGFIFCGYPAFYLLISGNYQMVLLGQIIIVVFAAGAMSASPGMMIEMTPVRLRLTICSIAYNIIIAVCGGTVPFFATFLIHKSHNMLIPFYYLMICAITSFLSVSFLSTLNKPR